MRFILFATLSISVFGLGCGDDETNCAKSDRDGTYLVHYTTLSGDCGDFPDAVVQLSGGEAGVLPGCTFHYQEWSKDKCEFESQYTCDFPADGLTADYVAKTEQENNRGGRVSGITTVTAYDIDTGDYVCMGTYELEFVRQ